VWDFSLAENHLDTLANALDLALSIFTNGAAEFLQETA
jgi:hypothetical protein